LREQFLEEMDAVTPWAEWHFGRKAHTGVDSKEVSCRSAF